MAKSKIHPQFFQTLAPDFHSHLTIPEDFFIKYIEDTSGEKKTVELKSNASEKIWKVKMIGRSLFDGWGEFAIASNFEVGDVVLVRYEGDLVFTVLGLGPNCSEIPDLTPKRINNDVDEEDDIGKTLLKKRLYPRTQVELSSEDENEFPRKKKAKNNGIDTESFVAVVTPSNLRTDTMNLPPSFASSNVISRKCHQIVLKGEGERSWTLDLAFNQSSDTFYISRGWRNFCEDNGQTAEDFFMFTLVDNGETPVLSFCPPEATSDRRQSDCSVASRRESLSNGFSSKEKNIEQEDECSSMDSLIDIEKKKYSPIRTSYALYWPDHKLYITFTLPPDCGKKQWLSLPKRFVTDNCISKPGKMYMSGKDGKRWPVNLLLDNSSGTMRMGSGWKQFVKANGLCTGKSFTLKLTWEDTVPVLSLCPADCSIDRGAGRVSSETNQKMSTPIGSSSRKKISKVENAKDDNSKAKISSWKRGKNNLRGRDPIPSNQKQFVTLTITPSSLVRSERNLPMKFASDNGINKPGIIYLCGKDGTKWRITLCQEKDGRMKLVGGWKKFVVANKLKPGDSFEFELRWEDGTPVLSMVCSNGNEKEPVSTEPRRKDSSSAIQNPLVCSKANEKEPVSTEPRSKDSSSAIQNRFVTLVLTAEDVETCQLYLPREFMKDNGINKLGEMTVLGKNKTKWSAYLMSRDGNVALGNGWVEFCEANGVKLGESFTLEFIKERNTVPVIKFCSQER